MAGSKKPRKRYDPNKAVRKVVNETMRRVKASPVTDAEAEPLELAVLSGLEEMRKGAAGPNEWNSVARGLNHAWTLTDLGIGPEALPVIDAAEAGMKRVGARYAKTQSLTLDAEGLADVRDAVYLWGRQLRMCTVGEVDKATRLVDAEYWRKQS